MQESQHIFIRHGLEFVLKKKQYPSILEIGLGTGLNCLLTFSKSLGISYTSIEKYPISLYLALEMGYCESDKEQLIYRQIHEAPWGEELNIDGNRLFKVQEDIIHCDVGINQYDIVYFDAFSPEAQSELWTEAIFLKMYNAMKVGGVLVTYCAKGVVKRTLKSVGFKLEHPPGPIGKREITRGVK
jgi:tRNA U34 5-methylaminomethyl-2-thiouridine-forming methyltransferase MnmC